MKHKMNLWDESFQKIKNKTKTIEMRLCDEKRSLIVVGDIIEFTNTKTDEILECINNVNVDSVNKVIDKVFDLNNLGVCIVGRDVENIKL